MLCLPCYVLLNTDITNKDLVMHTHYNSSFYSKYKINLIHQIILSISKSIPNLVYL